MQINFTFIHYAYIYIYICVCAFVCCVCMRVRVIIDVNVTYFFPHWIIYIQRQILFPCLSGFRLHMSNFIIIVNIHIYNNKI